MMQPKRIMLMYISEISGHHSATLAIERAIKNISPSTEIMNINAFNYTNPIAEKLVNRLYLGVIKRTPQVWEYLYDNPSVVEKLEGIKRAIHKLNSPKLRRLFERFNPDCIACSQAFPCGMVADYKKYYHSNVPLVAVLTDFIPHSYWLYESVDYYITPSEEITFRLIEKGIPAKKIRTFGIPFDHRFNIHIDRLQVMRKFGLDPELRTILIMGGGQGLGPIKAIVRSLENAHTDFQEIIVTATNKKLYRELRSKVNKSRHKIKLFGYVNTIPEFMAVSDLIITKPGGITTAEALSKNLPMIIVRPIPGQEANNTTFLTTKGAAIKVDDPRIIHKVVDDLFSNPEKLSAFRQAAARISKPRASMDIAEFLLQLAHAR